MHNLKRKIAFLICSAFICAGVALTDLPGSVADPRLLGFIPLNSVEAWAYDEVSVVPGGMAIGIKLYTKGLLIINVTSFERSDGAIVSPAIDSGIKTGDVILEINSMKVTGNENFSQYVAENGEKPINLKIQRKDKQFAISVRPQKAKDGKTCKIGAWVMDSAAGIGTLTFIRKDTNKFVALGHSINDIDVGLPYNVEKGSIEQADIISVVKGQRGMPGELRGTFSPDGHTIGTVQGNNDYGIYGPMTSEIDKESVKVASKWQVKEGAAQIISTVNGCDAQKYNIEIQKVAYSSQNSSKAMIIRITDETLLEKTGGIVQGMSGSPIIQDGFLVGAVTHVFVNDPTRGYAIFAETMLEATQ